MMGDDIGPVEVASCSPVKVTVFAPSSIRQVAIRAVNEGAVHRYFLKPWDDGALTGALEIQLHVSAPREAIGAR